MKQSRGEPLCPRCSSSNLTYKNVFDYYKCDECGITFITPVYSYGNEQRQGLDSAKDVASKIFGETQLKEPENTVRKPENIVRKTENVVKEPEARPIQERKTGNRTGLIAFLLICILILLGIIAWLLFDTQITDFFK